MTLSARPHFQPLGEGAFHAVLSACQGVAVVLFSAPHCAACRAWKALLPDALAGVAGHFFELDVVAATGVARSYDIFHLPTVYLFRDGRFHAELQCPTGAAAMRDAACALLAAPAQEEP